MKHPQSEDAQKDQIEFMLENGLSGLPESFAKLKQMQSRVPNLVKHLEIASDICT